VDRIALSQKRDPAVYRDYFWLSQPIRSRASRGDAIVLLDAPVILPSISTLTTQIPQISKDERTILAHAHQLISQH
jgi:hypothetical protein